METKIKEFKLIDGEFSAEESHKILMSILNHKIDFHSLFAFSNHIRFNKDLHVSKKRIEELSEAKEAISVLIAKAKADGYHFAIKSSVSLEMVKDTD
jgi:hypothetical protein